MPESLRHASAQERTEGDQRKQGDDRIRAGRFRYDPDDPSNPKRQSRGTGESCGSRLQAVLQVIEKTTLRAAEFAAAESHPTRLRDGCPNVRVVLDTRVLISALISGEGAPARLIDAWVDERFKLISSEDQLEEFKAMSRRPQLAPFIARADAGRLANQLRAGALIIEKLPPVNRTPSPADHLLLAMAKAADANYLVSGGHRGVFAFAQHGRTQIVTARSMLEALGLG